MNYFSMMQQYGKHLQATSAPTDSQAVGFSRRSFIKLVGVSGLAIGIVPLTAWSADNAEQSTELKPAQQPNAFVQIATDGTVTIQINRLEFGQGTLTGLAMVLADELDADWSKVNAVLAPADEPYKDPLFGIQMTGGSNSIANSFTQYRELGARIRVMLVNAAAQQWSVEPATLSTDNGFVIGADQKAGYGELATAAMQLEVPEKVALKDYADFKLIGKPVNRLDTPAKSKGKQSFGMDVKRSGMKTVLIARPPVFGGQVASFDAAAASAYKGVEKVLKVDLDRGATGVAVIADGYWPAKMGRDALTIEWDNSTIKHDDSETMLAEYSQLTTQTGLPARQADTSAIVNAPRKITAEYRFPMLAHTPMEPLNVTMEIQGSDADTHCTVWTGTQFQTIDQGTVAVILGLKPEQVTINTEQAGGGFGRRATPTSDYLADAARVMKAYQAAGGRSPIKVVWSREDDVKGGYYRPPAVHRAELGLDDSGNLLAWNHTVASPSILTGTVFESFLVKDGIDHTTVEGLADTPYQLPLAVGVHHPPINVPILWWRSVGHTHTAFVMETLIDELAEASQQDPVAYRKQLLGDNNPRHMAALELAVAKSGYGKNELPKGHAHGVAIHGSFNSVVAYVVEVSMVDSQPKVHKATAAIHCNTAVNPKSVEAQIQGSALMAIGTTLNGSQITLKDGVVEQSNFHNYTVARMPQMPIVDVHIVPSNDPPTGVGEPGLPPVAPAIANAVFALTAATTTRITIQPRLILDYAKSAR